MAVDAAQAKSPFPQCLLELADPAARVAYLGKCGGDARNSVPGRGTARQPTATAAVWMRTSPARSIRPPPANPGGDRMTPLRLRLPSELAARKTQIGQRETYPLAPHRPIAPAQIGADRRRPVHAARSPRRGMGTVCRAGRTRPGQATSGGSS